MNGPYNVIYCDPPWNYRDKQNHGDRGAGHKYQTMSLTALGNLKVSDLCQPDAACFMWATYPQLKESLALLDAWGFKFSTAPFTWIKLNKDMETVWPGSPLGSWTRPNAEIVIAGFRGVLSRVVSPGESSRMESTVMAARRKHSEKPLEVRYRIAKLTPGMRRIELFARHGGDENWDVWGNEIKSAPEAVTILDDNGSPF